MDQEAPGRAFGSVVTREWQIGADGLISDSQGHFDAAEYERQIEHGFGV
jgi:hypothetical protein